MLLTGRTKPRTVQQIPQGGCSPTALCVGFHQSPLSSAPACGYSAPSMDSHVEMIVHISTFLQTCANHQPSGLVGSMAMYGSHVRP